jgi:hypothetical protein
VSLCERSWDRCQASRRHFGMTDVRAGRSCRDEVAGRPGGWVVGVDTHRDTLTAAVTAVGGLLGQVTVAADAAGYRRLGRAWRVGGRGRPAQLAGPSWWQERRPGCRSCRAGGAGPTAPGGAAATGDREELRAELRGRRTSDQVSYCAALRDQPARSLEHRMTVRALRSTTHRVQILAADAIALQRYDRPQVEVVRVA